MSVNRKTKNLWKNFISLAFLAGEAYTRCKWNIFDEGSGNKLTLESKVSDCHLVEFLNTLGFRFHNFLISPDNRPVFVGNPLASGKLYELFQNALIQLNINN